MPVALKAPWTLRDSRPMPQSSRQTKIRSAMRLSFVLLVVAPQLSLVATGLWRLASPSTRRWPRPDVVLAKNARSLRGHEAGEERVPPLEKIDDLLARLEVAEANMLATLGKLDANLLNKIDKNPSARARIERWQEAGWNPVDVDNMVKRDYPSLSLTGAEWTAWKLYAAHYLRQYHSLNPTV